MAFSLQHLHNHKRIALQRGSSADRLSTRQNTSRWDDAPQWPRWTVPAPAGNPWSILPRYFLPDAAARTAWSGLPGSGMPGNQTSSATRDISGGTDRGYETSLRPRCPVPRASFYEDTQPEL